MYSQRRPGQPAVYGGATQYRSRAHKLATLVMMTTGSANATMFPMMFISYGGVPFLLAYLILLMTVAMPMMQLESNLAQFAGDGNCGIFSTVPLFLGMGYALTLYVILRVVAHSLPVSDVLLQIAGGSSVPWPGSCPGGWMANNHTCYAIKHGSFFYVMLGLHVATAVALLLRALSLEGAARGLQAFAYADWSHVLSAKMWCQALYTCLESVGVTGTVYLAIQRLNAFKNSFHEDVLYVLVADIACKGIGTFTAFLYLGYLSARMGVDVSVLIDYGAKTAAKKELSSQAQKSSESYLSYMQDVLALCRKADDGMDESEKVAHI
ncbi:sodium-dependent proline transporter-like [Rhipicephalus microplus]|uniref:sodium-dependent proline transporter-like n=1 Tax=Rhipicephalus microplus TaxID=6941 RepID=UPI003F6D009D